MDLEAWLEMTRPVNAIMSGLGVAVGYFVAANGFLVNEKLGLAMLSAMLIAIAGMIINDYFDKFIDARIKPNRPIPSGRVKASHALIVSTVVFILGVYLASTINQMTTYIALLAAIMLILYSWILAKIPLVGNATVALNTGLLFIFGEAAATNSVSSVNGLILFSLAFLSTLAREIYKDVEDVEGDKISRKTIPMVVGKQASIFLASVFTILAVIASPVPYLLGTMKSTYVIAIGIADLVFVYIAISSLIKEKIYSKELKIAQLLALIAFLIGL